MLLCAKAVVAILWQPVLDLTDPGFQLHKEMHISLGHMGCVVRVYLPKISCHLSGQYCSNFQIYLAVKLQLFLNLKE